MTEKCPVCEHDLHEGSCFCGCPGPDPNNWPITHESIDIWVDPRFSLTKGGTINVHFIEELSNLPRMIYAKVGASRPQSIAEHSFNVALLAWLFCNWLIREKDFKPGFDFFELVARAMIHDIHESVTGDVLRYVKTPDLREFQSELQGQLESQLHISRSSSPNRSKTLLNLIRVADNVDLVIGLKHHLDNPYCKGVHDAVIEWLTSDEDFKDLHVGEFLATLKW